MTETSTTEKNSTSDRSVAFPAIIKVLKRYDHPLTKKELGEKLAKAGVKTKGIYPPEAFALDIVNEDLVVDGYKVTRPARGQYAAVKTK